MRKSFAQATRPARTTQPTTPAVENATEAAASAKPGEAGPESTGKVSKPKVEKKPWGERDAEGILLTKLTAKPEDFNPEIHSPLMRKDFVHPADFLDYRAAAAEQHAAELRAQAKAERDGTGKTSAQKQKRLVKLKSQYEELLKELQAAGIDPAAALAVANG